MPGMKQLGTVENDKLVDHLSKYGYVSPLATCNKTSGFQLMC